MVSIPTVFPTMEPPISHQSPTWSAPVTSRTDPMLGTILLDLDTFHRQIGDDGDDGDDDDSDGDDDGDVEGDDDDDDDGDDDADFDDHDVDCDVNVGVDD